MSTIVMRTPICTLLLEAAVVGVTILAIGTPVGYACSEILSCLTDGEKRWNNLCMFCTFFFTGAIAHLVFEWSGINSYYLNYKLAAASP